MKTNTVRDRLWLWGMKVNVLQVSGYPGFGTSKLTTEDAIARTGIANVVMAGHLPITAETLRSMPSAKRIICKWSLHRQLPGGGLALDHEGCVEAMRSAKELAAFDARIDSFLIDDFSTGTMEAGVRPRDLARLQFVNASEAPHLPLMGTIYTMSLEKPELPALLPYFASYLVPLWHAADIRSLPSAVDRLGELSGGKPQLLCIYLHDFGNNKPVSADLMAEQLAVSEGLLRAGKVYGLVILGTCLMDLDLDANRCFNDWLARRGDRPIG